MAAADQPRIGAFFFSSFPSFLQDSRFSRRRGEEARLLPTLSWHVNQVMGSGQRAQLNQSVCTYTDAMTIGETAQISGSVHTAR